MLRDDDIAVLQFSGGKDSLACLYLLRPHWERITVAWVNTGAAYPETVRLMERVRAMVPHFLEINSNQPEQIARCGPPADIVPVRAGALGREMTQSSAAPVQSFLECCYANIWQPMARALADMGATLIIRGQKLADDHKTPIRSGYEVDGVRYWFPVEDWANERVLAYLAAQGVDLPAHYAYTETSLDCWSCTAYLRESMGRMRYTAKFHREKWIELREQLSKIDDAVSAEARIIQQARTYQRQPFAGDR